MSKKTYTPVTRALISVSDKTNIIEFVEKLASKEIHILSTGGTSKLLRDHGIAVTDVSNYTGFPEMMNGRVKTLHPKIYGGILGRRGIDDYEMNINKIPLIDLVVVNLYPFSDTIARSNCTPEEALENIDIGGPALLRAAAKNNSDVTVICEASDYELVAKELECHGGISDSTRKHLAAKAFNHTAHYDLIISKYLGADTPGIFPSELNLQFKKAQTMRYGENPHQSAALYAEINPPKGSILAAQLIQGKELSFNNIADSDAALECVSAFSKTACVIVKHANPCGVSVAPSIIEAYNRAFDTDPTAAFGGIIAFNREVDGQIAELIINKQFLEVLIAPSFTKEAKKLLKSKQNVRVLELGSINVIPMDKHDIRTISGGLLVQDKDTKQMSLHKLKVVSRVEPSPGQFDDLIFAWTVAKFVKSNAIVYAANQRTIGIGAGQMSRVYSAKIAGIKASDESLKIEGSVMASDAFFPFRDGIDAAAANGIQAVIQPGGSQRDAEVIDAVNEHGMSMVFTGVRHFRH